MKKGQRSWGRVLAPNLGNKANMDKHKIFHFRAPVTLKAVSLQLNGMLMMCKIQQTMQDDAIRTTRIHPAVRPGNRDEVFICQEVSGFPVIYPPFLRRFHTHSTGLLEAI